MVLSFLSVDAPLGSFVSTVPFIGHALCLPSDELAVWSPWPLWPLVATVYTLLAAIV